MICVFEYSILFAATDYYYQEYGVYMILMGILSPRLWTEYMKHAMFNAVSCVIIIIIKRSSLGILPGFLPFCCLATGRYICFCFISISRKGRRPALMIV